ncbi:hypothetical protein [Streptomyces sp. NBC_01353]|uniref:hypothetical protein n=1 Tax=Streptomyces sp. NBC_01353 TaxID=2903835 RepID=UPI002E319AAE|nr:hypothetical protein [Streptomyces sp. NBC_01353]
MGAQLKATVFVKDPDTRQTVELAPGTCPEPRLASLVTNPAAWVDGKLPRLRAASKSEADTTDSGDGDPTDPDENPDDVSTEPSAPVVEEEKPAARTAAKKTAAKKTAATAAEGTGGQ